MPASGGGGGGGAAVTSRAYYSGLATNIANNATAPLTWDTKLLGDALLNISTPGIPTIVTAGVYAVSVTIISTLTAAGWYGASLDLDYLGDDASVIASSPVASVASPAPEVVLSLTYYIPTGGQVRVTVDNHDGASARDFFLVIGVLQRLS